MKGLEFEPSDKVIKLKVFGDNSTKIDVAEYVLAGYIDMKVEFDDRESIDSDIDMKIDMTYDVVMKVRL